MSIGLSLKGKATGIDPNPVPGKTGDEAFPVYADRDAVGPWEEVELSDHGTYVTVRYLEANRWLTITPDGRLESRSTLNGPGEWEQLKLYSVQDKTFIGRDAVPLRLEVSGYSPSVPIHLEQRGNDFVDEQGNRIIFPCTDQFFALRQYLDGGAAALMPAVEESKRLGFRSWRVWSQGSKRQNTIADLSPHESGYYEYLRGFVDTLNANGIVPLFTVFVDNQDLRSPIGHWTQCAERLRGSKTLLSGFNEWQKNMSDFDPWALPDPGGFIWSRGSDVTQDKQCAPKGATASELHATRNAWPRALMDSTASPPNMRSVSGSTMVWMTEGQPFGDGEGYSEQEAWQLGRGYSIDWALAVFHNRFGQRMLLMSEDVARRAAAFVRGMQL